jgi:hypothetical protein
MRFSRARPGPGHNDLNQANGVRRGPSLAGRCKVGQAHFWCSLSTYRHPPHALRENSENFPDQAGYRARRYSKTRRVGLPAVSGRGLAGPQTAGHSQEGDEANKHQEP